VTKTINAALAALLALVLIAVVVVLLGGNKVLPWTTHAQRQIDRYGDVQQAASRSVLAFLDVDYQDMDARIKKVESLATGTFKTQYAATSTDLKAAAQQAQAKSTGRVRYVGVNKVSGSTATALVAADVVVANTSTAQQKATKTCPHAGARCDQYRFVVTLTKTGSGWKMSNLAGVS
jgi:Mce-associated membrane protein